MDLSLDEQRLLAEFRKLRSADQKELVDYVALLVKKKQEAEIAEGETVNQCSIKLAEDRPETAKEPIFTE